jgi:CheY-like chemotaxis protein
LVDDLLDVSRISGGKVELQRSRVPLAEVVAAAVEIARTLVDTRCIKIDLNVPDDLVVDGDRTRLTQVVSNLLHNAAKYGRVGGNIWVTGERHANGLLLIFRDDGIGITADMLPRVFDLFSQESQALDRAQGGLGLGLAIVKSLVESHGGSVVAHSAGADQGATFIVRLPTPEGVPSAEMISQSPPSVGQSARVLIVDDNEDALELLVLAIELLGNEVFSAPDGAQALTLAEQRCPDIAFLDVGLPDMSGYELARRIRELDLQPRTKLVAVTGYGRADDRERAFQAGFDAHLTKPVSLQEIQQMLETLRAAAQ